MIVRRYDHFYFTFVTPVLIRLKKHIETDFSFLKDKKIIVAISGGIDSVVLAHLLLQLKFQISFAHCNFGLRGKASDEDQLFVEELAKKMNIPFFSIAFDTKNYAAKTGASIQMAARELRYTWFEKLRMENSFDFVTTAHHLDDNLETFLINFTRGTGLSGLAGIPPVNGTIVRLLLPFSKAEIEQYAKDHSITWREDQSNKETTYKRNKIRHQIIPLLKELNPQLIASFKKTTKYLNESQQIINDAAELVKKDIVTSEKKGSLKIDLQKLKKLKGTKVYLFELLKDFSFTEWNDIEYLIYAQSGKVIYSETHRLIKDRDHFFLEPRISQNQTSSFHIVKGQNTVILENFKLHITETIASENTENNNAVQVDAEKLQFPLELRKWKNGDFFYPLGMTGKKKISKFFKDEKLSLLEKEKTWLLCSNNEIIWVVNRRLDDRFKITSSTNKKILIEYIKS